MRAEGAAFYFFDRFGGPGLADRCFRDRLSADLGLLCAAAAAGKQYLGSSFWSTWALTGAQRHRQAVFREQFLPTWALTGTQHRRQAVFREQFLPTWALTGAQRHRQAVFREQFLPTWALTGARRRLRFRAGAQTRTGHQSPGNCAGLGPSITAMLSPTMLAKDLPWNNRTTP